MSFYSCPRRRKEKKKTLHLIPLTNSFLTSVESWVGVLLLCFSFHLLRGQHMQQHETWPQRLVSMWPCKLCLGQFGYTHSWIMWLSLSPSQLINIRELPWETSCPIKPTRSNVDTGYMPELSSLGLFLFSPLASVSPQCEAGFVCPIHPKTCTSVMHSKPKRLTS